MKEFVLTFFIFLLLLEYLERRTQERLARIATARERGELHDCEICATEDVYEEDMLSCPAGHFHCRQCVRMAAESWASQGWTTFPCLSGQCEHNYSLFSLQQVLLERTLSLVVRRVQEEELRTARIPDLVSCPFCPYAVIIPGESSRVFHCENPECMKDSCRFVTTASSLLVLVFIFCFYINVYHKE